MKFALACNEILHQLADLVSAIRDEDFVRPSKALSGATIGQHLRHTLEFFICFEEGCRNGIINYDKRNHDRVMETDRRVATNEINRIIAFISSFDFGLPLKLEVNYDYTADHADVLPTTSARELVYNIEHAVHHMALMKIGVNELAPYITLPPGFGIAASTIRHQRQHTFSASDAVAR